MATTSRAGIDAFKAAVVNDFARPNLFQVDLEFPGSLSGALGDAAGSLKVLGGFQVKAANLPASQLGVIEVPFRGRTLKIAGDRTFEPWTITIMNDSQFAMRKAFEAWVTAIQAANENYTSSAFNNLGNAEDTRGYFADMKVSQLSRGGEVIASYNFINVFPSNVSAIDLDFGSNDAIEEFTVELQVQYWYPDEEPGVDNTLAG